MLLSCLEKIISEINSGQQPYSLTEGLSLYCYTTDVLPLDPFNLINTLAAGLPKFFWKGNGTDDFYLGVGIALEMAADSPRDLGKVTRKLDKIVHSFEQNSDATFFGGTAFPAVVESGKWTEFPGCGYFLPRILLKKSNDSYRITVLFDSANTAEQLQQLERLQGWMVPAASPERLTAQRFSHSPQRAEWDARVEQVLASLQVGKFKKLVVSRSVRCVVAGGGPAVLLSKLSEGMPYGDLFMFCPMGGDSFLGCTPERVFSLVGRELESEMLGGTRPRSSDSELDYNLERELLESDKERFEHECIREQMLEAFGLLVEQPAISERPEILKLSTVQHLRSEIRGQLKRGVDLADIMSALYPSSAVGGLPTEVALAELGELESESRGWYAGAYGVFGPGLAECGIGIRSALLKEETLTVFAGCGIVPGSSAVGEWLETRYKLMALLQCWDLDQEYEAARLLDKHSAG